MACLLALTLLGILATGAVTLQGHAFQLLTPLNRLLDHLGHDAPALAQANERPSL